MESLKSKIFILLILVLAFNTSAFLLYAYSSLLDFFPWGNSDSYVIWEPLVLYFLVPPLILIGWVVIILSKQRKHGLFGFHLLIIGVGFTLPSIFGFDLRTDVAGRWCGVIVAAIGKLLTMIDVLIIIEGKEIASFTR